MHAAVIAVLALVGFAMPTASGTTPRLADPVAQTWVVDGVTRRGLVAAPAPVAGGSVPLVIVFHGHGGTALAVTRTFAIHTYWPEALVVYPQGLPTPGIVLDREGKFAGWQSVVGEQGDRDLKLFDAIVNWAKSAHRIDDQRIYAAGHSNGGSMVYALWASRSAQLAAVAPTASVFGRNLANAKPLPALIVAGEKDPMVSIAAQQRSIASVLKLNRCESPSTPWSGPAVVYRSPIKADVVTYVHPGAHALPSDAGALIAKFFREH